MIVIVNRLVDAALSLLTDPIRLTEAKPALQTLADSTKRINLDELECLCLNNN
jgi:hypothetical protein